MLTLWRILTRKKTISGNVEESSLARVLNTFDLTALGVGSTLGVGLYVLVGKVAKETAGPSVVLSFLIAAIASAFAGLCYAEFGARTPRAGSAYIYSYVCVGEFIAFVIGWNLILEYIIGSASVARGMSLYVDALVNNTIKDTFIDIAPIGVSFLSPYFDFLSFSIAMVLSVGLAFGLKESSKANNVFTVLNIGVVLFVVIAGSTKADIKNWEIKVPSNVTDAGTGGFFPFGVTGMIKGAATCFYGFVGFDCIATTGEEVKNPQKAIPFAIILSLLIVFIAYFSTATVVTLMVPYYLQNVDSPIPHAFDEFGWNVAKWIVTIGGIFALLASLFGAMFPLPRIIYAMANDGLVFRFLGKVNQRFSTPVIGTLFAGFLTGLMAAMFEQGQLVDMMSIGTLLAYTIVAACVLLLRYSVDEENYTLVHSDSDSSVNTYSVNEDVPEEGKTASMDDINEIAADEFSCSGFIKQIFNIRKLSQPSKLTERLVTFEVCFYSLLCLLLGFCAKYLIDDISHGVAYAIAIPSIIGFLMIVTMMSITTQPNSKKFLHFKVPFVPLVPAISILVNIYLMMSLDVTTWIRFGVWMAIGLPIYLFSAHCTSKDAPASKSKHQKRVSNGNTYINAGYVDDEKIDTNSDSAFYEGNESGDKVEESNGNVGKVVKFDRKMSVDTISNSSNTVVQENVIALIHREDSPIVEEDEEQEAAVKGLDEVIGLEEVRLDNVEESNEGDARTDEGLDLFNDINNIVKIEEDKMKKADANKNGKDDTFKKSDTILNENYNDDQSLVEESNKLIHVVIDLEKTSTEANHKNVAGLKEDALPQVDLNAGAITLENEVMSVVNDINDIVKIEEEKLKQSNLSEAVNEVMQDDNDVINIDDLPEAINAAVQELEKVIESEEERLGQALIPSPRTSISITISPPPPPPPPMVDLASYNPLKIPRLIVRKKSSVRDERPQSPVIDYDDDDDDVNPTDAIKIGSKEHKNFTLKLNSIFGNSPTKLSSYKSLDEMAFKASILEPAANKSSLSLNDADEHPSYRGDLRRSFDGDTHSEDDSRKDVEELGIDAIKSKLNNFLKSKAPTSKPLPINKHNDSKNVARIFPLNKDQQAHKELMQKSLNIIKLRTLESNPRSDVDS